MNEYIEHTGKWVWSQVNMT